MQRFFSPLFLFCLSMIYSQEKLNCEKEYHLAKERYELFFGDISQINYQSLPKVIIDNMDLEKIKGKNLILYYSNVTEADPSGVPREIRECKRFYPPVAYFNEEKLWGDNHILYLQSKIRKNIVPKTSLGFVNSENEFVRIFKTGNFKKGVMTRSKQIYYPGSERYFLYFPVHSSKLIINKSSDESDVYENSTTLMTKVTNNSSKEVKVEYIFENDPSLNYTQTFNSVNNEWKLVNNK